MSDKDVTKMEHTGERKLLLKGNFLLSNHPMMRLRAYGKGRLVLLWGDSLFSTLLCEVLTEPERDILQVVFMPLNVESDGLK